MYETVMIMRSHLQQLLSRAPPLLKPLKFMIQVSYWVIHLLSFSMPLHCNPSIATIGRRHDWAFLALSCFLMPNHNYLVDILLSLENKYQQEQGRVVQQMAPTHGKLFGGVLPVSYIEQHHKPPRIEDIFPLKSFGGIWVGFQLLHFHHLQGDHSKVHHLLTLFIVLGKKLI